MSDSPLREWAQVTPFVPFTVTTASGRAVRVLSADMIILGKRWDTVAYVDADGDDHTVLIHHDHIGTVAAADPAVPGASEG